MTEPQHTSRPEGDEPKRRRGRPRSEGLRREILRAAADLLADRGVEGTTVEAIAERAKVGKQTIYRRWPTRAAVLVDAFLNQQDRTTGLPDSGSTRKDLLQLLSAMSDASNAPEFRRSVVGLAAAGHSDEEVGVLFRERFVAASRVPLRTALERATARGELDPEMDQELLLDVLQGAIWYRSLLCASRVDRAYVEALVALVFGGAGPREATVGDGRKGRGKKEEGRRRGMIDLFE